VETSDAVIPLSPAGHEIQAYLGTPPEKRSPVGFDRAFLDSYGQGGASLLTGEERAELHRLGRTHLVDLAAGTYARQILDRLLIDLSWSSSRLEGNTYTLLDTRRLLAFSQEAEGKQRWEAQMLLNHKEAIEFLVDSAEEIGFDRYSILNLHALLASDLLPDPAAAGRLRHIGVGIGGSTYLPLEVPQLIEECFDQLLRTASAIEDPFEQALYAMVYLPYLQPFDDVNKRVSRLAANIPFLRANLCPLSFTDVPRDLYNQGCLGVYELQRVELLRDVFLWAYRRSAERYAAIQQSLGQPDPFRLRHRQQIRQLIAEVIRGGLSRGDALAHLTRRTGEQIPEQERERFREVVEGELLAVHEGNFARYRVKPSEFRAWRERW
jgi:fido (protein-threonine AMPylation protein)